MLASVFHSPKIIAMKGTLPQPQVEVLTWEFLKMVRPLQLALFMGNYNKATIWDRLGDPYFEKYPPELDADLKPSWPGTEERYQKGPFDWNWLVGTQEPNESTRATCQ